MAWLRKLTLTFLPSNPSKAHHRKGLLAGLIMLAAQ